jgi:hypothetical protein
MVAILVAGGARSDRPGISYPASEASPGHVNYRMARKVQWLSRGDLPTGTKAIFAGVVRYSRPGLFFPAALAVAVPDPQGTVAMLYVDAHDRRAGTPLDRLGRGDCKLNFSGPTAPRDGEAIQVRGILKAGAYKDLIIDVETWQKI